MRILRWLLVALTVLLLVMFASRLQREQVLVHLPPSNAAQTNPFLAAMRLLENNRIDARHFPVGQHIVLPNTDTLLVLDQTRTRLDEQTALALMDWLGEGGHLVMAVRSGNEEAAEWRQRLPMLASLGLDVQETDEGWNPDVEQPFIHQLELAGELFMRLCVGASAEMQVLCENALCDGPTLPPDTWLYPQGDVPLRAQLDSSQDLLIDEQADTILPVAVQLAGGNRHGDQWLDLSVGHGRLVLITSASLWHNQHLHWLDHAELLLQLAEGHQAVWFASAIGVPPLQRWLWQRGWPLLIALTVLLALLIASRLPRRGPTLSAPAQQQHDFSRHLLAAGQLLARRRDYPNLLAPLRSEIQTRVANHGIAPRQAVRWIAQRTGLPRDDVREALETTPESRAAAQRIINRLQTLRNQL